MTKDVLVHVKGRQGRFDLPEEEAEVLETFHRGSYYQKEEKQYLFYEEYLEDEKEVIKNAIRLEPGMLLMTKKGAVESSMVFVPGEKTNSIYHSPAGSIELSCDTTVLTVTEEQQQIEIWLQYTLEMNQSYVSDNRVEITIQAVSGGDMQALESE